jgi:hypothetical protein
VAGDRRTRRLTEDTSPGQSTLDPSPPAVEPPAEIDPSEVLEPPPMQRSSARLEERQQRWFRMREAVMKLGDLASAPDADPAENPAPDPKG